MKLQFQNGDTLEHKYDAFYVTSQSGKNVFINEEDTKIPTENRVYLENGDSFAIVSNQLYVFTKSATVYVNDEKRFYVFPSYVSESFRDFCEQAVELKTKEIHGQSFVSAKFELSNCFFTILSPSIKNGQYTFIFKDAFSLTGANIAQNIENIQKNITQLYGCSVEYSYEKNVLLVKMKRFDFNPLFHLLYQLKSPFGQSEMSHYTA